jgi:hypothetical protein
MSIVEDIYLAALKNWIPTDPIRGDSIKGTSKNEAIDGCGGNDTIRAGAGNDWVNGGEGKDNMWGGAGRDVFSFAGDAVYGDRINDFVRGKDIIALDIQWMPGISGFESLVINEMRGDWVHVTAPGTNFDITVNVLG